MNCSLRYSCCIQYPMLSIMPWFNHILLQKNDAELKNEDRSFDELSQLRIPLEVVEKECRGYPLRVVQIRVRGVVYDSNSFLYWLQVQFIVFPMIGYLDSLCVPSIHSFFSINSNRHTRHCLDIPTIYA